MAVGAPAPCTARVTAAHCGDVIMGKMASQITSLTIVYSTVYSGADQRKHQSSASLAFVRGIHREPLNSPHKWPVTRKMFTFDELLNLRALKFSPVNKINIFQCMDKIFCGEFQRYPLKFHTNILPIHWKISFLYNTDILGALRFKSSCEFLKPQG